MCPNKMLEERLEYEDKIASLEQRLEHQATPLRQLSITSSTDNGASTVAGQSIHIPSSGEVPLSPLASRLFVPFSMKTETPWANGDEAICDRSGRSGGEKRLDRRKSNGEPDPKLDSWNQVLEVAISEEQQRKNGAKNKFHEAMFVDTRVQTDARGDEMDSEVVALKQTLNQQQVRSQQSLGVPVVPHPQVRRGACKSIVSSLSSPPESPVYQQAKPKVSVLNRPSSQPSTGLQAWTTTAHSSTSSDKTKPSAVNDFQRTAQRSQCRSSSFQGVSGHLPPSPSSKYRSNTGLCSTRGKAGHSESGCGSEGAEALMLADDDKNEQSRSSVFGGLVDANDGDDDKNEQSRSSVFGGLVDANDGVPTLTEDDYQYAAKQHGVYKGTSTESFPKPSQFRQNAGPDPVVSTVSSNPTFPWGQSQSFKSATTARNQEPALLSSLSSLKTPEHSNSAVQRGTHQSGLSSIKRGGRANFMSPETRAQKPSDPGAALGELTKSPTADIAVDGVIQTRDELKKMFETIGSRNLDEEVIESSGNGEAKDYTRSLYGESLKNLASPIPETTAIPTMASGGVMTSTFGRRASKPQRNSFSRDEMSNASSTTPLLDMTKPSQSAPVARNSDLTRGPARGARIGHQPLLGLSSTKRGGRVNSMSPETRAQNPSDPGAALEELTKSPTADIAADGAAQTSDELKKMFETIGSRNLDEEVIESSGNAEAKDYTRSLYGESLKNLTSPILETTAIPTVASGEVITSTFGRRASKPQKNSFSRDEMSYASSTSSLSDMPKPSPSAQVTRNSDLTKGPARGASIGHRPLPAADGANGSAVGARKTPTMDRKTEPTPSVPTAENGATITNQQPGKTAENELKQNNFTIGSRNNDAQVIESMGAAQASDYTRTKLGESLKHNAEVPDKSVPALGSGGVITTPFGMSRKTTNSLSSSSLLQQQLEPACQEQTTKDKKISPSTADAEKTEINQDEPNISEESFDPGELKSLFAAKAADSKPLMPSSHRASYSHSWRPKEDEHEKSEDSKKGMDNSDTTQPKGKTIDGPNRHKKNNKSTNSDTAESTTVEGGKGGATTTTPLEARVAEATSASASVGGYSKSSAKKRTAKRRMSEPAAGLTTASGNTISISKPLATSGSTHTTAARIDVGNGNLSDTPCFQIVNGRLFKNAEDIVKSRNVKKKKTPRKSAC